MEIAVNWITDLKSLCVTPIAKLWDQSTYTQKSLCIFGGYLTYLGFLLSRAYIRESSRKYNVWSTGEQVMQNIDLNGKFAIITGCSSGLGKETARVMISRGCSVIMANRNQTKSESVKNDIVSSFAEKQQKNIAQRMILMKLDLSSLQSVYEFAAEFVAKKYKCDYLINNAGVFALPQYIATMDDIEAQFGVNHLAHWYLTTLLLKPVLIPNKTRVITLSSYGHRFISYDQLNGIFDDCIKQKTFMGTRNNDYEAYVNYGIAKGSNLLFARELNRLYSKYGIVSVSAHPGFIQTDLGRDAGSLMMTLKMLPMILFTDFMVTEAKDIPKGSATTLRCVALSNDEIFGGELYYNCIPASVDGQYGDCAIIRKEDDILAKKLWKLSEIIVENKGFELELGE